MLLACGRGSIRSWYRAHQQKWVGITSMAFGENSLALTITGGFTQCPGPATTHRSGSTVETPGYGGELFSEGQTPVMTQSPGATAITSPREGQTPPLAPGRGNPHHQPPGGAAPIISPWEGSFSSPRSPVPPTYPNLCPAPSLPARVLLLPVLSPSHTPWQQPSQCSYELSPGLSQAGPDLHPQEETAFFP